jgi:hypothetical protein
VKETRAELVKHFAEGCFVHPAALFVPTADAITAWAERHASAAEDELESPDEASGDFDDDAAGDETDESVGAYAVAAE